MKRRLALTDPHRRALPSCSSCRGCWPTQPSCPGNSLQVLLTSADAQNSKALQTPMLSTLLCPQSCSLLTAVPDPFCNPTISTTRLDQRRVTHVVFVLPMPLIITMPLVMAIVDPALAAPAPTAKAVAVALGDLSGFCMILHA